MNASAATNAAAVGLIAWSFVGLGAASSAFAQTVDVSSGEAMTVEIDDENPPPPKSPDVAATVQGIVKRSNAFRQQEGKGELAVDQALQQTAQDFANYMAEHDRYGHQADDRTPADRVKAQGYQYAIVLENIAYAYDSRGFDAPALTEKLVQGWIDSPPHRENLLDPDVTQIGVGVAESSKTHYWYAVQMFGRPASLAVEFTMFNSTQTPVTYELDGTTFALEPRYARTHRASRPPELTVRWPAEAKLLPTTFKPQSGVRYRVETTDEGKFRLDAAWAKPPEAPAAETSSS